MDSKGNSDQITRDYFDSLLLETRYMDAVLPSVKMDLWGHTYDTPIMTAALSHLHSKVVVGENCVQDGMTVYAEAARQVNTLHWVGMGSDEELEQIAATGARCIKIIKPHADNNEVLRKMEHAVKCGCVAVGMDIDHAFDGKGGYDNVFGLEMRPKTTREIASFVQAAGVPFVVKGVLSVQDAVRCAEAGCAGILVSHHHGMIPYAVPPLMVLPEILKAVGPEIPVFVDCGIMSGVDAYKCLALGAKAVGVGRHLMPLLRKGPDAVAGRMREMTAELAGVMSRTGVADLQHMDPSVVHYKW